MDDVDVTRTIAILGMALTLLLGGIAFVLTLPVA